MIGYQQKADTYRQERQAAQTLGDSFAAGIEVDHIQLGGLTMQQALQRFDEQNTRRAEDFTVTVSASGRQWRVTSNEVPLVFNAEQVLERAYQIGRVGTIDERAAALHDAANGVSLETSYEYDRSSIERLVAQIAAAVDREPTDAGLDAFDPETKTFHFKAEIAGWSIDRQNLTERILSALDDKRYGEVIEATGESIQPQVTLADLQGHFGLMASYTTETTTDKDRNTNISISAAALSERVVQPGDTLSFNGCTGKRTGEKGYREAGAIAGGILVDDTGGGVCQTSSTLFNAVVRADLEIVKRYAHSWPSSYVPRGEDATVNWPSRDFVFRNSSDYPVFIIAWYENRHVTVEVYGKLPQTYATIQLESQTIRTIKPSKDVLFTLDESLPVGTRQAGRSRHTGYVVDTYKVYFDAEGNELNREKLWTTEYPATQDEILYH